MATEREIESKREQASKLEAMSNFLIKEHSKVIRKFLKSNERILSQVSSGIITCCTQYFSQLSWEEKKQQLEKILNLDPDLLIEKYKSKPKNLKKSSDYSRFLGDVELDTSVLASFCELLAKHFEDLQVHIVDPLVWKNNVERVGLDLGFRHQIYKEGIQQIHIGVHDAGHYFSIHVLVDDSSIYVMDSLSVSPSLVHRRHVYLLIQNLHWCHNFDLKKWKLFFVVDNPKQNNTIDCGVYMAKALEFWVQGKKLPFDQDIARNARFILLEQLTQSCI